MVFQLLSLPRRHLVLVHPVPPSSSASPSSRSGLGRLSHHLAMVISTSPYDPTNNSFNRLQHQHNATPLALPLWPGPPCTISTLVLNLSLICSLIFLPSSLGSWILVRQGLQILTLLSKTYEEFSPGLDPASLHQVAQKAILNLNHLHLRTSLSPGPGPSPSHSAVHVCLHFQGYGQVRLPYKPLCTLRGRWCSWLTDVRTIQCGFIHSSRSHAVRTSLGAHADISPYTTYQCHAPRGRATTRCVYSPATGGRLLAG